MWDADRVDERQIKSTSEYGAGTGDKDRVGQAQSMTETEQHRDRVAQRQSRTETRYEAE